MIIGCTSVYSQSTSHLDTAYMYLRIKYYQESFIDFTNISLFLSDDNIAVGEGHADVPFLQNLDSYTYDPDARELYNLWSRNYHGIYHSNKAIELGNNTTEEGRREIAEALFLRAYLHFEMFCFFKDVPYHSSAIEKDLYPIESGSTAEILTSVSNDLRKAIPNLPMTLESKSSTVSLITKGTAQALLGKVFLYMASPYFNLGQNYYDSAAFYLDDVIQSMEYSLLPDYADIWTPENEYSIESLFEINYYNSDETPWNGPSSVLLTGGNITIQFNGPRLMQSVTNDTLKPGWGFDMITEDLVSAFDHAGDLIRKNASILTSEQVELWGGSYDHPSIDFSGYHTNKRLTWTHSWHQDNSIWGWGTNERIIRFADVLLMAAEAYNRKSLPNDSKALDYVNRVRSRVNLPMLYSTGEELYDTLKFERRLEFADEGQRFFDLVRWNDAEEVLGSSGFVAGVSERFPIPSLVVQLSCNRIPQHSHYSTLFADTMKPIIDCPEDVIINNETCPLDTTGVAIGKPIVYDNCTTVIVSNDLGSEYNNGVNTIMWTVTDKAGKTATCTQTVTVNCISSSIEQHSLEAFKVFPNPCSGSLTIDNQEYSGSIKIEFYNSIGQVVEVENISNFSSSKTICTNTLKKGMYLLKIKTDNSLIHKYIIVQ